MLRDDLRDDRTKFPHTLYMVAGTQATNAQDNHIALLKLTGFTREKHGKADKALPGSDDDMDDGSDSRSELQSILGLITIHPCHVPSTS